MMKTLRATLQLCSASLVAFVGLSLISGVGGQAESRKAEARVGWLQPLNALFGAKESSGLTAATVQSIFENHLRGFTAGQEAELAQHFMAVCQRHHFDPAFVLSLMFIESGFRAGIVSPSGAIGLLQVMPVTGRHVARRLGLPFHGDASLKDPFVNITLGLSYLAELRDRYRGLSPYFHLAAFNMGPAKLDALRSRPGFQPVRTLKYYEDVMKGVDQWRYYAVRQARLLEDRARGGGSARKLTRSGGEPVRLKDQTT